VPPPSVVVAQDESPEVSVVEDALAQKRPAESLIEPGGRPVVTVGRE